MKKTIILLAIIGSTFLVNAQSESYQTFKKKFAKEDDVTSIEVNGFFFRTLLAIGGEYEARQALRNIRTVRLTTVPTRAFEAKRVTVTGFKNMLRGDSFEEMLNIREDGENVTVFVKAQGKRDNCYLLLAEDRDEVVVIEVTGYLDPELLKGQILSIDI